MLTNLTIKKQNLDIAGFPYCMEVLKNKKTFLETYKSLSNFFYEKMFEFVEPGKQCDIFVLQELKKSGHYRDIIGHLSKGMSLPLDVSAASDEQINEQFCEHFYIILWVFDFTCDEFNKHYPMSLCDAPWGGECTDDRE